MEGKGRARSGRLGVMLGVLLGAGALLVPASASALTYEFRETFGSASKPIFVTPEGLAVDQSNGDLLVIDAGAGTVSRWNPDGSAADFSALGTNVIDGNGSLPCTPPSVECDGTPQNGLSFGAASEVQMAVDNSGGETDGNIYVTQGASHLIDIFGEDGSFLGQLTFGPGEVCGVGVDPDGNVYAGDFSFNKVRKFEPTGPVPENTDNTLNFTATEVCTLAAGAGPSAGSVFVTRFGGAVNKFDGSTGEAKYPVSSGSNTTVTVNPATGNVFVAKGTAVSTYDASGAIEAELELLSSFSVPTNVTGIAVDGASGDAYVARAGSTQIEVWKANTLELPKPITEAASEVAGTEATLSGSVNPKGLPLTACFFEWGETASYGEVAPCEEPDAAEVGEGTSPVAVHADISGLDPAKVYHFRLLAGNANGTAHGEDEVLQTLGPSVSAGSASQVSASGAKITGEVNPNGEATSFVVQYVSDQKFNESQYAEATPAPLSPKAVGSGSVPVEVSQQLSGLSSDTTYHFRIVASNAAATNEGPDRTFTTFPEAPAGLPDARAYEMVSPPQKAGEVFPPDPLEELGGSCTSECLPGIFLEMAPMQARPDGEAVVYEGQPFAAGQASGTNEYLAGRSPEGWQNEDLSSALSQYEEHQGYMAFSDDLSRAVVYQIEPVLSPEAPAREGKSFANLYLRQEGVLEPLVVEEPPQRTPGQTPVETRFELAYGGANTGTPLTPAFSHIAFAANDVLTEATTFAPKAPEIEAGQRCRLFGADCNLYEWDEGELRLVNVLPGKTAAPHAVIGSRLLESEPPAVDHAISDDGSRIFWSDEAGQVFVRIDGEETREIEAPGRFLTANPEGTKVLLGQGCLYDLETEVCEDLTEGEGGFQGILGTSEDLSCIYYVDTKALSGEEKNANGEKAVEEAGKFNLYAWQEGTITFIGTLLAADNSLLKVGDWKPSSARRSAQASPDGRFLAFMSMARLTGYDNRAQGDVPCRKHGSSPATACNEVFEYDAESGELVCVSCSPSGQRPIGESNLSLIQETVAASAAPFPAPHNVTTDGQGRIFFESQDALTSRDTNAGIQDVYEWEPNGVGSCERAAGCVYLISSGKAANDSMFFNSTPNGDDAFFVTREQLLPRDKDEKLDLYDARVGGGFTEGETPPCDPESCAEAIPSPPAQPTPGSVGFSGPGNPKPKPPCKKGFVRKHGKCVKKHKKHKKHKRAAKHRRGGAK